MRQMLYKSKETMATENVIADDSNLQELRAKGWLTADEVLALPAGTLAPAAETPAPAPVANSVGIDVDGDDKVDVRVSINEGAASVAIAKPASVPAKQTSKRGRPKNRR